MDKKSKERFDPSQISKKADFRRKPISLMTIILLIFLAASFWIYLVTIEVAPNPFLVVY